MATRANKTNWFWVGKLQGNRKSWRCVTLLQWKLNFNRKLLKFRGVLIGKNEKNPRRTHHFGNVNLRKKDSHQKRFLNKWHLTVAKSHFSTASTVPTVLLKFTWIEADRHGEQTSRKNGNKSESSIVRIYQGRGTAAAGLQSQCEHKVVGALLRKCLCRLLFANL